MSIKLNASIILTAPRILFDSIKSLFKWIIDRINQVSNASWDKIKSSWWDCWLLADKLRCGGIVQQVLDHLVPFEDGTAATGRHPLGFPSIPWRLFGDPRQEPLLVHSATTNIHITDIISVLQNCKVKHIHTTDINTRSAYNRHIPVIAIEIVIEQFQFQILFQCLQSPL